MTLRVNSPEWLVDLIPQEVITDYVKAPPAYVYRVYGMNDELLYIGSTISPKRRFYAHSRVTRWWPQAARKDAELHATYWHGRLAEAIAIKMERPQFNFQHAQRPQAISKRGMELMHEIRSSANPESKLRLLMRSPGLGSHQRKVLAMAFAMGQLLGEGPVPEAL